MILIHERRNNEVETIDLLIYPNPTTRNEGLYIAFRNELNTDAEYSIYNLNMQLLNSGILQSKHSKLEINDLTNGIYFIKVQNKINGTESIQKFIIQ